MSTVAATRISKVERLMNLVIALLSTRSYLTADRIAPTSRATATRATRLLPDVRARQERTAGSGHPAGDRPGQRLPEPTEGYRIKPDAYALPDIAPDAGRGRGGGGGDPGTVGIAGRITAAQARC